MSLLQAHGHPNANRYHIGRVFDEARLVVEQRNGEMATLGVIIQAATGTTGFTANKKAGEHFQKLIKTLSGEE